MSEELRQYRLCGILDQPDDYPSMLPHAPQLNLWSGGTNPDLYEIPEVTPISDQGGLGSCAANAWCDLLETVRGVEDMRTGQTPSVEQLSRLFAYWVGRCTHQGQLRDEGTYLSGIARQLVELGVPPESAWPYEEDKVFTTPSLAAHSMASDNQVTSIFKVPWSGDILDNIALCITANQPVTIGGPVGPDYMAYRGGDQVFGVPSDVKGRHAQIICGVRRVNNKREFKLRNSWSYRWGERGYAWVTEEYVRVCDDFWSASRMLPLLL